MTKYLITDVETTGIEFDTYSILTLYMGIAELNEETNQFSISADIELKIKHDLETLQYTEEALAINNINLKEHMSDPESITEQEAADKIRIFVMTNHASWMAVAGQNVAFDVNHINELFKRCGEKSPLYHRTLDAMTIWLFLLTTGSVKTTNTKIRLQDMCEYFGIPYVNAHEAKEDCLLTLSVIGKMIELQKEVLSLR